jgi:hypothetical protein
MVFGVRGIVGVNAGTESATDIVGDICVSGEMFVFDVEKG